MQEMLLGQFVLLDESYWPLIIAVGIALLVFWGYLRLLSRRQNQLIDEIDRLLASRPSMSVSEIAVTLDSKGMDLTTVHRLIERSRNGILSYSRTSVVSRPILYDRLKEGLTNNSIVHVDKESMRWDILPSIIEEIVQQLSDAENLDVLRTRDSDYLLVSELKERLRESLELQGRVDIISEAQRLRVDVEELVNLIRTWGWYVWQSSSGLLYSVKWLLSSLERSTSRNGFLDLEAESERLDLSPEDITRVLALYKWDFVEGYDNRIIPVHLLRDNLLSKLKQQGSLDVHVEANRLKVPPDVLQGILAKLGLTLISTEDGSVMTLDQVKSEINQDIDLAGILHPDDIAHRIGIEARLVERILARNPNVRKLRDGRFVSYKALRNHILEEVKASGILKPEEFTKRWMLNRVELAALLKRFGLKTVMTKSGNYLSISWLRRHLMELLDAGHVLDPYAIAKQFDTEAGVVESIVASTESDTLLDEEGKLISRPALLSELKREFEEMGILRPYDIAAQRGLDITEVEKTIQPLTTDAFETWDDNYVNKTWLMRTVSDLLSRVGIADVAAMGEKWQLDIEEVLLELEGRLTNATVLEDCGVVISDSWLSLLQEYAAKSGPIEVTEFARARSLSKKTALCILRSVLSGVYLPSTDTFFTKT